MPKFFISILALCAPLCVYGQAAEKHLSLNEALAIAHEQNLTLALAREAIATAKAEGQELNSMWYPTLAITGEYSHSLTEIAAVTTIGEIGGELLGNIAPTIGEIPIINELVKSISTSQLRLPIVPRNSAEVGAELLWVVFSGGRRIAASRISMGMLSVAEEQYTATANGVAAAVAEAYWGLVLARELTSVRRSALALYGEHLRQARRLEEEGMINRTERLVAEVAYDQSATLLASAQSNERVAANILASLLNADSLRITPTTPLSVPSTIPTKEELMTLSTSAPTINALRSSRDIASTALSAERSRYLPAIALMAHQQLWSSGLDKNMFPHTLIGIGLEWTLFDGMARESAIARSKSTLRSAQTTLQKVKEELYVAIDKYYSLLTTSLDEYRAQQTTLALAEELHRAQLRAFAEGMATSSDVVDATHRLSEVRLAQLATLYAIDSSLATLLMLVGRADSLTTYFTSQQP